MLAASEGDGVEVAAPQPPRFLMPSERPPGSQTQRGAKHHRGPPEGPCTDSPAQPRKQPAAWQCWEEVGLGEHLGPTSPHSWSPTLCQEHRGAKRPRAGLQPGPSAQPQGAERGGLGPESEREEGRGDTRRRNRCHLRAWRHSKCRSNFKAVVSSHNSL